MFKRLKAGLGGGGVGIDTVLSDPNVYPGGVLEGVINVTGGEVELKINFIELALEATVEVEYETSEGDGEYQGRRAFAKSKVVDDFELAAGASHQIPFQFQVPVETPPNVFGGQDLTKCQIGVRTELDIHRARDKGDLDPIRVHALPAQERIVQAFAQLGFGFKGADFEAGKISGSSLPFYQEIEFSPSMEFAGKINELEVTLLSSQASFDVLLELDKKGGFLSEGHDQITRFTVPWQGWENQPWEQLLQQHLQQLTQKRGLFG